MLPLFNLSMVPLHILGDVYVSIVISTNRQFVNPTVTLLAITVLISSEQLNNASVVLTKKVDHLLSKT